MPMIRFDKLVGHSGQKVAVSAWLQIPQALINTFAEFTGDKNPIHLSLRSAQLAGFEKPIAHGYLLIALIPQLLGYCIELPRDGILINRALEWKFQKPVLSGDSIRLWVKVLNVKNLRGVTTVRIGITIETLSNNIAGKGIATFVHLASTRGG